MRVLIQCGDHFENQSRVFLLAREIFKAGHEPIILMYVPYSGNIFKNAGIQVVALNDYLAAPTQQKLNLESTVYKDLKVKDFLSVEVKRRPDLTWASRQGRTAEGLSRHLKALQQIIDAVKPDHIVVWNGFTGFVANVLRVLCEVDGIPSSFIERGLFKDSIFLDREGVNGAASIHHADPKRFDPAVLTPQDREVLGNYFNLNREPQALDPAEDLPQLTGKRVVFFPLQVQLDTNIVLYSKYKSMREAFFKIYEQLNDGNTAFVLRPHPEENPDQKLNIPVLPNVIVSMDKDLQYWISRCDLVVTINSTVGLEALIEHKPVVCLGGSIYSAFSNLATLKKPQVDAVACESELMGYLGYFMQHNLIKSDSYWNQQVVNAQLQLSGAVSPREFSLDAQVTAVKARLNNTTRPVVVKLAFSFDTRLNLTYRKISEAVDKAWIKQLVAKYLNHGEIRFAEDEEKHIDILIVAENQAFSAGDATLVIDLYGICLAIDGKVLI